MGHWIREWQNRIADEKSKRKKTSSESSGTAYLCDISAFCSDTTDDDKSVWIADSGASMYMTFQNDVFKEFGAVQDVAFVKIADDKVLPVTGVGTVDVKAHVNGKWVDRKLTNVLLVPNLRRNLFTLGAINDKGFSFHSYLDRCEIREKTGTLSAGVRHGRSFKMLFKIVKSADCNVVEVNSLKLWHYRLGHIKHSDNQEHG